MVGSRESRFASWRFQDLKDVVCLRTSARDMTMLICGRLAAIAACVAGCALAIDCTGRSTYSAKRMPDGKQWMTDNLNVAAEGSSCCGGVESSCRQYGRLYTWEAGGGCQSLRDGWRLPTQDEWRQLARRSRILLVGDGEQPAQRLVLQLRKEWSIFNRQREGKKQMAISVRCVND